MKQLRAWLTAAMNFLPGSFALASSRRNRPVPIGDHATLSWREVADFRERLKGISPENALEVLRVMRRSLDEVKGGGTKGER